MMNDIEKLAIEHLKQSGWGVKPFYQGNLEQLEAFAQALQSSEPVAEPFGYWHQGETYEESEFHLNSESGDVSCEHCVKLYTHPPSTVRLEKRIAELVEALEASNESMHECAVSDLTSDRLAYKFMDARILADDVLAKVKGK